MPKKKRLTWYEKVCCCCKLRSKFMNIICVIVLYVIPIFLLLSAGATCIVLGLVYRQDCSANYIVPYYLITCSVTPFLLLFFVKGLKDKGHGITMWRFWSLFFYCIFTVWLIIGSVWTYNTYTETLTCNSCCNKALIIYTLVMTCVHWLFFVLATIPQVIIFTKICCCCKEDADEDEDAENEEKSQKMDSEYGT